VPFPITSLSLNANSLNLTINLTINSTCSLPYCEEINNKFFYYIPISRYMEPSTSLDLVFK
jgi:hypothetical protein